MNDSDQVHSEQRIQIDQRILQAILDNTTAVIYAKDRFGRYWLINNRYQELFDVTLEQIRGKTDYDMFTPDQARIFTDNDRLVLRQNHEIEFEELAPHNDGMHTYISLKFPVRDEDGNAVGICGISTDITLRKQIEAKLQENEQLLRQLAENATECFWIREAPDWNLIYLSPAFSQIWGRALGDMNVSANDWLNGIHPADRERVETSLNRPTENTKYEERYRVIRPDGEVRWILDRGAPILDHEGNAYRMVGTAEDITERRLLEWEVAEVSNHERNRISNELHDSLGQQLTGLGYIANSLERKLSSENHKDRELAKMIRAGIQDAIAETRRIVRGLSPVVLDEFGIATALNQLAQQTQNTSGINCVFEENDLVGIEDHDIATQVFRIAQEAVNNAVKHAEATKITICLSSNAQNVFVEICDNGKGMPEEAETQGMGLRIMRHRCSLMGSEFRLRSTPGQGTSIICVIERDGEL